MSEYIEIEAEPGEHPQEMEFYTNLTLTVEGLEEYDSREAMEIGSPLAQMLSAIPGIVRLRIEDSDMTIRRDPAVPWHIIIADVSAVVKEFFL